MKKPVAIVTSTNAKNRNDCTEVTVARHGMQLMRFEMNITCKAFRLKFDQKVTQKDFQSSKET